MSHAGAFRTLAVLVVAVSLVACSGDDDDRIAGHTDPSGPVHINFSCGDTLSIGLADGSGNPAWTFSTKKKDTVSWVVPANVAINSILPKTAADTLPLDSAGTQGHAPGVAFISKVKDSNKPTTDYHYKIDATCHPATGPDVRLLIDPDMIVR